MLDNEKNAFKMRLSTFFSLNNKKIDEVTLTAWFDLLKQYDMALVFDSMDRCRENSGDMPDAYDVRQQCRSVLNTEAKKAQSAEFLRQQKELEESKPKIEGKAERVYHSPETGYQPKTEVGKYFFDLAERLERKEATPEELFKAIQTKLCEKVSM